MSAPIFIAPCCCQRLLRLSARREAFCVSRNSNGSGNGNGNARSWCYRGSGLTRGASLATAKSCRVTVQVEGGTERWRSRSGLWIKAMCCIDTVKVEGGKSGVAGFEVDPRIRDTRCSVSERWRLAPSASSVCASNDRAFGEDKTALLRHET
jgi:hypothetical protein